MRWNAVQQDARRHRYLIFAMDQGQTDVLKVPGPWGSITPEGYCLGLVAKWVSLQYNGENFLIDPDTPVCATPPWDSTIAQTVSNDLYAKSGRAHWRDQLRAAVGVFHCRLSPGLHAARGTGATAAFLWSVMSKAYGCYGVVIGGVDGAHAIALRHGRDNRYHLFDPNHFHIRMPDKESFLEYTDRYLGMAGYDSAYGMDTIVMGIQPPI
jgi:hypothetical protein